MASHLQDSRRGRTREGEVLGPALSWIKLSDLEELGGVALILGGGTFSGRHHHEFVLRLAGVGYDKVVGRADGEAGHGGGDLELGQGDVHHGGTTCCARPRLCAATGYREDEEAEEEGRANDASLHECAPSARSYVTPVASRETTCLCRSTAE